VGAALIALALAGASCGGRATSTTQLAPATHPALFYDAATFFSSVRAAAALPLPEGEVAGAIIPHDWRGGGTSRGSSARWRSATRPLR